MQGGGFTARGMVAAIGGISPQQTEVRPRRRLIGAVLHRAQLNEKEARMTVV